MVSAIEQELLSVGCKRQQVAAGQCLFSTGDQCESFVLVTSGRIRVELLSITGHQLLLYRIHDGQSCVMTTACLLGGNNYTAQALTECDTEILLVPQTLFQTLLYESASFRKFVFNGFADRLSSLMQRTGELATFTIDQRLVSALLAHKQLSGDAVIKLTHEELAIEIGSAREVVSRRLAVLEKDGLIRKHRGSLEIINTSDLHRLLSQ